MDRAQYEQFVLQKCATSDAKQQLLMAQIGMADEYLEFKQIKPEEGNRSHVIKELGDFVYYYTLGYLAANLNYEDIPMLNGFQNHQEFEELLQACLDTIKKHVFHGHRLNVMPLLLLLGQLRYHLVATASALGVTVQDVIVVNVEKLNRRYPGQFESWRSQHRESGDISIQNREVRA